MSKQYSVTKVNNTPADSSGNVSITAGGATINDVTPSTTEVYSSQKTTDIFVAKQSGKSLILDSEITRLEGVTNQTKSSLGLDNVNNTSDINKPVSTASQNALNLKANIASPTFTGTVSGINKTMVGLDNVDNTSDVDKPISTATGTALDAKANKLELKSASFTAVNESRYSINATSTITNPTGVVGKGYEFEVLSGIVTVGGNEYGARSMVRVKFQGGAFQYYHYIDSNDLVITTSSNISTDASWKGRFIKIVNGASNINITVNNSMTCAGTKSGMGDLVFVSGTQTLTAVDGILTSAGNIGSTFAMTKRESATNGVNVYITNR